MTQTLGVSVARNQDQEIWCKPAGHVLKVSHRMRVLDEADQGWVCDEIATAAMKVVKLEHPEIDGLRPSSLFSGQTRAPSEERRAHKVWLRNLAYAINFDQPKGRQAQILYTGSRHWVLVSNYHEFEEELVYVYDSQDAVVPDFLIHKVAAVFRFSTSDFRVAWPVVDQQTNFKDCGIFAIAFLVALSLKRDPTTLKFGSSRKMREHLARCYEQGSFSTLGFFPTKEAKSHGRLEAFNGVVGDFSKCIHRFRHRIRLPERIVHIICRCRMPPGRGKKDRVVICRSEFCTIKTFHETCVCVFDKDHYWERDRKVWICPACRQMDSTKM